MAERNIISQAGRYCVAGGLALGTHLLVLVALVELFDLPKYLASLVGFLCAVPVNYLFQHSFVFGQSQNHAVFFSRYIGVTAAAALLNTVLFAGLVRLELMPYPAAQILVTMIVFVVNFIVNRSFTFKTGHKA